MDYLSLLPLLLLIFPGLLISFVIYPGGDLDVIERLLVIAVLSVAILSIMSMVVCTLRLPLNAKNASAVLLALSSVSGAVAAWRSRKNVRDGSA